MMRGKGKLIAFFIGASLAVAAGVVAQSGGFPSRPTFQQVKVGAPVAGVANPTSPSRVYVNGNATYVPLISQINTSGPADEKTWDSFVDNVTGDLSFRTVTDLYLAANTWLRVSRTGTTVDAINLTATAVQANGSGICTYAGGACSTTATQTRHAYGCIGGASGLVLSGCSSSAISSSRTSVGTYALTFSANFQPGVQPNCTVVSASASPAVFTFSSSGPTNGSVNAFNLSGALIDNSFYITCMGT